MPEPRAACVVHVGEVATALIDPDPSGFLTLDLDTGSRAPCSYRECESRAPFSITRLPPPAPIPGAVPAASGPPVTAPESPPSPPSTSEGGAAVSLTESAPPQDRAQEAEAQPSAPAIEHDPEPAPAPEPSPEAPPAPPEPSEPAESPPAPSGAIYELRACADHLGEAVMRVRERLSPTKPVGILNLRDGSPCFHEGDHMAEHTVFGKEEGK